MLTALASIIDPANVPSMKDIVSQVLLKSIEAVQNGAEWVKGQIPDVLTQFMQWQLAYHTIWGLVALIVTILLMILLVNAFKSDGWDDAALFGLIFSTLISIVFFMYHLFCVVEIKIAPKVFLLEYAASLIKN